MLALPPTCTQLERGSFREEREANPNFSALMQYSSLNNACQRYLIETNGYNDLVVLLEVNAMAMPTIPPQPSSIQIELEGDLGLPGAKRWHE
ncbi:hypothetical protein J3459_017961 [Metarhizium acridum]|nr:hypothetical protein J3459_017961 [Metarhizium acridum]